MTCTQGRIDGNGETGTVRSGIRQCDATVGAVLCGRTEEGKRAGVLLQHGAVRHNKRVSLGRTGRYESTVVGEIIDGTGPRSHFEEWFTVPARHYRSYCLEPMVGLEKHEETNVALFRYSYICWFLQRGREFEQKFCV